MPTHISSYRYTRLNIVDILDPDVNGEFSSAPIGDGKGRFNEISCDQVTLITIKLLMPRIWFISSNH